MPPPPFPSDGFSGVVRYGDESRAFGFADRAHEIPNTVVGDRGPERISGGDAGVSFYSARGRFTVISNTSRGARPIVEALL